MSGVNGRVLLSAVDLLGLADKKKVARLDLEPLGFGGVVFVCDLTTAQQQKILGSPRKGTKVRRHDKEHWTEFDLADLTNHAGAAFLEACLVTDSAGGETLERAFAAAEDEDGEPPEWITFPASELVYMAELMVAELKQPRLMREKLDQFPNAVTSLIVKTVREISGMGEEAEDAEDAVEEKKGSS